MRIINEWAFLALLVLVGHEVKASQPSIDIKVKPIVENGVYYFSVDIVNISKDDIFLRRNSLPLAGSSGALSIKAYPADNGFHEIKAFSKVIDLIGVEKLSPGQVFTGKINICLRYPSLAKLSSRSDIVFLWIFPSGSSGKKFSTPIAGTVVLDHALKCENDLASA
ncbi:MAG: hypothetical protein KA144_02755 [Xanthomonadaceae bacterium]|nr:hypothetical protein [Xanthomonadaceae bacterium]